MLNVKQPRLFKKQNSVSCITFKRFYLPLIYYTLDRVQRAKEARSEAAKEIENIKAQKNEEYQNFIAQVCLFRTILTYSIIY